MNTQTHFGTKQKHFFAVDLGATSGRTIVGTFSDGKLNLEEISRFDNRLIEVGRHVYWDIFALYAEIIGGLRLAAQRGIDIESIGIDTWGVDFVCFGDDGAPLRNPLAYRDPQTFEAIDHYLANVHDRETVYNITGIEFMNFNSLYQLHAMHREGNSALKNAAKILFMPDALNYMLTGEAACEYTIASTSQLIDPKTKDFSPELLASVGLRREQFGRMVMPGTKIGTLTPEIQRLTGLGAVPVVAVAGHDTASAIAAVPAKTDRFAYLSSGTWSLMGIELASPAITPRSRELDFTNEGGVDGRTCFLKNICGMWLYERCRKEWTESGLSGLSHAELLASTMHAEPFRSIIHPDDPTFANPSSMVAAIQEFCRKTGQPVPETTAEICRCIFESLALRYRQVFGWLKSFSPAPIDVLHIIGGGSQNAILNQMTADACNVTVLAGPQECTALGNVMVQAKAAGLATDIREMRQFIADAVELRRFEPQETVGWSEVYERFSGL
ncbi:MAG: rhamnulokinase [Prevotella sp.]|nr:rhamnulokinase [Prevotella sp.]